MVKKNHYIELYINGKQVEFDSQEDVDIRFNNVLFDPTKITSNQSEYSFEFELPCTPQNNKIFEYANNLSKLNKFHARYDGELYADGTLIFKGSVTLNSISNKHYNINLVQIKNYSLEEIFGEATMNEIPWEIEYDGAPSINEYNADSNSKVAFPLISYGVFQKVPYYEDKVAKDYTSVYDIDKYNIWYQDTFAPSLNMLELMKRAFEWKGYTVQGDAMNDYFLKDVFCSTNIAQDQVPIYNLGNPKFGAVSLRTQWRAKKDTSEKMYGNIQDIKFKQMQGYEDDIWNWDKIRLYDMLNSEEGAESITMLSGDTYMYQPNENCIVIPADGFYEITMDASTTLEQTSDLIYGKQYVHSYGINPNFDDWVNLSFKPNFRITSPIEIQLVKNYNNDVELIHGAYYVRIRSGYPDSNTSKENQRSLYPHEKIGTLADAPFADTSFFTANGVNYVEKMDANYPSMSYLNVNASVLAYDPLLNPNFICGFTSIGNEDGAGSVSIIKNGYSWCSLYSENHDSIYKSFGYLRQDKNERGGYSLKQTDYQKNTYPNSPDNNFTMMSNHMHARIHCLVKLQKDDILKLFAVHRHYEYTEGTPTSWLSAATYTTSADVNLTIRAMSPNNYAWVRRKEIGYGDTSEFSTKLNVTNWQNQETKVSDWIQHIADAFNLKIEQFDKTVTINLNKQNSVIGNPSAVDIDNRVNAEGEEVESEMIDYPRSMAVKYKINTDEHGFYDSVPPERLEQDDWEDYGDYGYDEIMLNDDSYVTSTNDKNLQFSYTWYDDFYWFGKDHERKDGTPYTTLNVPTISKEEYMIDHSKMQDKAMLRDGFSLAQRFWFRPSLATDGSSNPLKVTTVDTNEDIYLYTTKNHKDELNLSYKLSEKSLLKQYFDISAHLSSNFVNVEVYLTPEEYNRIKNGAYVRFDSDLYKVCQIEGFSPSGQDPTTLELMKVVTA